MAEEKTQYAKLLDIMREYKVGRKCALKILAANESSSTQEGKDVMIGEALRAAERYKNRGARSLKQLADNRAAIDHMFELGKRRRSSLSYADCMGRKEVEY